MADEHRTLWHLVAVVATLALSVVVAVVAVTRNEPSGEPTAEPTAATTPTATATSSPSGLNGEGPYVLYRTGLSVIAFDLATGTRAALATLRDAPIPFRSWQPGSGRIIGFATNGGDVWSITRRGAKQVGAVSSDTTTLMFGGAISPDDRKLAVLVRPRIAIVDLLSGRPTFINPPRSGEYPRENGFAPTAWSLGGTVLYGVPACEGCSPAPPGLYAFDTNARTSVRIAGTANTIFYDAVAANSGQALYYGNGASRRCRANESEPCEGPPYYLRRISAGDAGSSIIRRANDYPFFVDAISLDGRLLLVRRPISEREGARLELYSAEGERQPALQGIPEGGGKGVAILPDDVYLLETPGPNGVRLILIENGAERTVAEAPSDGSLEYLGWLK